METETVTLTRCDCRDLSHEDTCPDNPDAARCELCDTGLSSSEVHAAEFGRSLCADCCHHEARKSWGPCCETFN